MAKQTPRSTRLCGSDESNIMIRNKNLVNELIGKLSFTEMLLFHISGEMPSALQIRVTDAVLVTIMEHGLVPSAIASRLTLLGAPEAFRFDGAGALID